MSGGHDPITGVYRWRNVCLRSEGAPLGHAPRSAAHERFVGSMEYQPMRGGAARTVELRRFVYDDVEAAAAAAAAATATATASSQQQRQNHSAASTDSSSSASASSSSPPSPSSSSSSLSAISWSSSSPPLSVLDMRVLLVPVDWRSDSARHIMYRVIAARRVARATRRLKHEALPGSRRVLKP